MDSTVGLRERKKAETRQAVHEAALRLSVEHGLEHVTVEAIADAVNISRRTFSNYFTSKEEALLYGEEQRLHALAQTVRDRPAGEPAWQALRLSVHELQSEIDDPEKNWAIRTRLAQRHPSLLARQLANYTTLERELAQAITEREGADPHAPLRPRVMAAAFLVAMRIAMHTWIDEHQSRPLSDIMDEVLDQMAQPFDSDRPRHHATHETHQSPK